MSDTGLKIWNQFPKTDEKYTKAANVDGNKLTSLDGVYMVKLATEVLGPIGEGWGYSIISERMDDTKPMMLNNEVMKDNGAFVWEKTHTLLIQMWAGTKDNSFQQYGHTKYRYMTNNGKIYVDHEYAKKSVTDAMKKCLSLLGVCSDVFMGEFDDHGYKQEAKLENDLKKADHADEQYTLKIKELRAFVADKVDAIAMVPNMEAVGSVYGMASGKIDREAPILGLKPEEEKKTLDAAYHEAKKKLEDKA